MPPTTMAREDWGPEKGRSCHQDIRQVLDDHPVLQHRARESGSDLARFTTSLVP